MIGVAIDSSHVPSSLIFHTKMDDADETAGNAVWITTDIMGFQRPTEKLLVSKQTKESIEVQPPPSLGPAMSVGTAMLDNERKWVRLDHFLPDNKGLYKDLNSLSRSS
jgi:hypothetical protein